jgi:hypothetical protein
LREYIRETLAPSTLLPTAATSAPTLGRPGTVYMTLDSTLAALSSEIIGQIVENLSLHLKISATQLRPEAAGGSRRA